MDNPETLATLGTETRMDNPETQATLGTQDTGQTIQRHWQHWAHKNGQSKDTGNIGHTRHRTKVRENQRSNQEWTIQRHWTDNPKTLSTLGTQDTGRKQTQHKQLNVPLLINECIISFQLYIIILQF
jgi:hypothetical protein